MNVLITTGRKRFWTFDTLDLAAVVFLLGVFTVALMRLDWPLVKFVSGHKWYGYGIFFVYAIYRNAHKFRMPRSPIAALWISLPLVGTISSVVFSFHLDEALQRILSFWVLFILAFLLPIPADPRERLVVWARALFYVSAGVVFASILLAGDPSLYKGHRFIGCMNHMNYLAAFSAVTALSLLIKIFAALPKINILHLAGLAGSLYCLLASGARADLVGVLCASIVITYCLLTRNNFFIILGGVIALGLFAIAAPQFFSRFSPSEIGVREFRMSDRTLIWAAQIESFLEHPWLGWGFEFGLTEHGFGRSGGEGAYTDLLSAVGVIGAVPFFFALVLALLKYGRLVRKDMAGALFGLHRGTDLVYGLAIVVYALVTSIAEPWMATVGTPIAIFVWIVLAGAAVARPIRIRTTTARPAWVPNLESNTLVTHPQ